MPAGPPPTVLPARATRTLAEAEIARTQKNKATEYHMGQLKARLAKLRTEVRCRSRGRTTVGVGPTGGCFGFGARRLPLPLPGLCVCVCVCVSTLQL